jgi:hypothetical protein
VKTRPGGSLPPPRQRVAATDANLTSLEHAPEPDPRFVTFSSHLLPAPRGRWGCRVWRGPGPRAGASSAPGGRERCQRLGRPWLLSGASATSGAKSGSRRTPRCRPGPPTNGLVEIDQGLVGSDQPRWHGRGRAPPCASPGGRSRAGPRSPPGRRPAKLDPSRLRR